MADEKTVYENCGRIFFPIIFADLFSPVLNRLQITKLQDDWQQDRNFENCRLVAESVSDEFMKE